jgi:hypothetical protein
MTFLSMPAPARVLLLAKISRGAFCPTPARAAILDAAED